MLREENGSIVLWVYLREFTMVLLGIDVPLTSEHIGLVPRQPGQK